LTKLKFTLKNTQLAQVLESTKAKIAAAGAVTEKGKDKLKREELSKKPKSRIVQPKEAAPSPVVSAILEEFKPEKEEPVGPLPVVEKEESVEPVSKEETKVLVEDGESSAPVRKVLPAKELKVQKRKEVRAFDVRDRQGLRDVENEAWRKRRAYKPAKRRQQEEFILRPKSISVRLPITVKDLAHEMKVKASQLIEKLFKKGLTLTLNDFLDDETVVQLLGVELDCTIEIDTSEQERIRITDQSIRQEIEASPVAALTLRPPVVAFMGHVDHGKTSLIDAIRKSNRAASEAGMITQHIGAFKVSVPAGEVTILDTPGHEAFSEMRSRGANVTDIVILVVAGDEGIRAQTDEAIRQAREAKVPILVAVNKCDKPGFDVQNIYKELADRELLPEAWGGTTITVSCSAVTGQGVNELLEMIALQAEILELRANPEARARGTVLESEMHKGLGAVATVLVQNGTLRENDAIVFGHFSGRIKTMHNEFGHALHEAGPSTPVKVTGLSELALAGEEFIVVKSEKEARALAEERVAGHKRSLLQQAKIGGLERMMAKKESGEKKILPVLLRADVQGSLEALRNSLFKIHSEKVRLEVVSESVGEISESDIELAAASKATLIGFHTRIASHAEELLKQKGVQVVLHDIIYHLIDEVKKLMRTLLPKIEKEEELGVAVVKAVFRSSQLGLIAGCQVMEGLVRRTALLRQVRNDRVIWKGRVASLKRGKEDVKEVVKGLECGILLDGRADIKDGDLLQAYEITYLEQEL
jgi:translation initiation factor IF-2